MGDGRGELLLLLLEYSRGWIDDYLYLFLWERVHVWHYYIYMKYRMMNDFVCGSATDTNIPYLTYIYKSMYRGSTNSDNAVYGIYHHDRYLVASLLDNGRVADLPPTGA